MYSATWATGLFHIALRSEKRQFTAASFLSTVYHPVCRHFRSLVWLAHCATLEKEPSLISLACLCETTARIPSPFFSLLLMATCKRHKILASWQARMLFSWALHMALSLPHFKNSFLNHSVSVDPPSLTVYILFHFKVEQNSLICHLCGLLCSTLHSVRPIWCAYTCMFAPLFLPLPSLVFCDSSDWAAWAQIIFVFCFGVISRTSEPVYK